MPAQALLTGNGDSRNTLITVFLRGAADGLTLVAPLEDDAYHRARPRIGVKKSEAVPLDGFFGFSPWLKELEPAWKEGDLALIHAAGSEDQTRSHFEAQDLMEHGGLTAGGWMGRYLRTRPEAGTGALTGVAIGRLLPECFLGAPMTAVMERLEDFSFGAGAEGFHRELKALYALERGILGGAAHDTFEALNRIEALRTTKYVPANGATYAADEFAQGLQQLARLIKARVGMEAASIDLGGWDSHFTQQTVMEPLARRLSQGLAAFRRDLGPALLGEVTVVVMTEFGRRLHENSGFGTDHGRGGVMFVMGGGVRGGRMIGKWPGLSDDKLEGPGDVPVVTNYRNVLGPILRRHGLSDAGMVKVFPDFELKPVELYA